MLPMTCEEPPRTKKLAEDMLPVACLCCGVGVVMLLLLPTEVLKGVLVGIQNKNAVAPTG